jgi:hypothetical protein
MYVASSYHVNPDEVQGYKEWLLSDEAADLFERVEAETGFRYDGSYFTIYGFGEYTCETWWEVDGWSTLGNMRASAAGVEWLETSGQYIDGTRAFDSRALRSASDIQVFESD